MYNVGFTVDNIDFGSEPPALFKQLFLGDGSYLNSLIDGLNKDISHGITDKNNPPKLKSSIEEFMKEYNKLLATQLNAYQYCPNIMPCCDNSKGKIDYDSLSSKLLKLKMDYYEYEEELNNGIADAQKRGAEINKCKEEKKKLEGEIAKATPAEKLKIQKKINELACGNEDTDKTIKTLNLSQTNLDKLWALISKITEQELMKIILFNNNLNADHFSYNSPPIFPKGNKLTIGLNITPADSSLIKKWSIMPLYNDSLSVDLFVKGKWFVSFSSGPFVGIGEKLRTETYGWQQQANANGIITDSAQYKLVSTGKAGAPIGIAAFGNIGTKLIPGFGIGISTGVGIAIGKKSKPVYFVGGSLFFGELRQFNITGGLSLMEVDHLKSELYPGIGTTLYSSKPDDVEYIKKINMGGFVSISYTIFKSDKSKNVKSASKK
ncbi:MAG: hypothetical protein V4506_09545 [Bacteroidota bacterium]